MARHTKAQVRAAAAERVQYYTATLLVDPKARVVKRGDVWLVDAQIRLRDSEVE